MEKPEKNSNGSFYDYFFLPIQVIITFFFGSFEVSCCDQFFHLFLFFFYYKKVEQTCAVYLDFAL